MPVARPILPVAPRLGLVLGLGLVFGLAAAPAWAANNYDFLAAPQIDLNRIFRVDKSTGEVGACQFGLKEGSPVGVTLCYPPGQGAGPQTPSDYTLVASRHEHEAGAWRVDLRTGQMSICYVLDDAVVCTPPAK
ncbi:hypothetical protein RHAL1_01769 [Beijerinckiaceae bacterium RH AL1]|nr:hypothetical protein [Beijerinckiaceae bacterium]VVB45441.1 hypothetical protein RHCH11_RHCH11_01731 [Beijerinckiaceae bacterium RH CH11]VVB45518.1 hypothetical protein RHAL8_01727 [Beijerinckiaceae bacterium RH AL8]VVC54867.1 hypothetical protein RHAL1_01769 [Beijerinckiaceae bacterium RH AL1]